MKKATIIFVAMSIIISGYTMNGMNIQTSNLKSKKDSVAFQAYQALLRRQKDKKKKTHAVADRAKTVVQTIVRDPMSAGCYGATAVVLAAYAYIKITS